jgi:hypothetical protein
MILKNNPIKIRRIPIKTYRAPSSNKDILSPPLEESRMKHIPL